MPKKRKIREEEQDTSSSKRQSGVENRESSMVEIKDKLMQDAFDAASSSDAAAASSDIEEAGVEEFDLETQKELQKITERFSRMLLTERQSFNSPVKAKPRMFSNHPPRLDQQVQRPLARSLSAEPLRMFSSQSPSDQQVKRPLCSRNLFKL